MKTLQVTCVLALVAMASSVSGAPPQDFSQPVTVYKGNTAAVVELAFHPDDQRIVSVSPQDVRIWNAVDGTASEQREILGGWTVGIGFDDAEHAMLAVTQFQQQPRKRTVDVLPLTGEPRTISIDPFRPQVGRSAFLPRVGSLAFSPDGTILATAGSTTVIGGPHGWPGGAVKLFDVKTGKELRHLGEVILYKRDGSFDAVTPAADEQRPGASTSTFAGVVTWSSDGTLLAAGTDGVGGELPETGKVLIWNPDSGQLVKSFLARDEVEPGEYFSSVTAIALSGDNKLVAAAVGTHPSRSDGLIVDEGPATIIRVWDIATGDERFTLEGHKHAVQKVKFSPDGKWIASAGNDRVIRVWNAATGAEEFALSFDVPLIYSLAFSPDGKKLAAGAGDASSGEVRVWNFGVK